jgi:hypothetical protein
MLSAQRTRFLTINGFTYYLYIFLRLENGAQSVSNNRVIVRYKNTNFWNWIRRDLRHKSLRFICETNN